MRARRVVLVMGAALALLGAGSAAAEPPQQLDTEPGVPVPLAVESSTHPDCSVGALPEMKVVAAPAHGELTLREGQLRRRGSACPASPGYVVLYVPDEDFNGADMVTIEVLSEGEAAMTLAFDIRIRGKVAAPAGGV